MAEIDSPAVIDKPWNNFIQRLEDKIGDILKRREPLQRGYLEGSPLIARIVSYPTPAKFKPPVVTPKYDGSTNLVHHMEMYQSTAYIFSVSDEMRSRVFSNIVIGDVHVLYTSLLKNSIENFEQLA